MLMRRRNPARFSRIPDMYLGPLLFEEIFRPLPWGGRALARLAGKRLPPGKPIGESWEISDENVAAEGPLAGRTLQEILDAEPVGLIGRRMKRFPLLIKLLDMKERLSVQVHPHDSLARAMKLQDPGKTEAWYILRSGAPGCLVAGLKSKPGKSHLSEVGDIESLLIRRSPKAGELWFIEAGAIHCGGCGMVVLEVQQNSNTTFRLHDWGRVGLDGKPRALHLKEARRAVVPGLQVRRQAARKLRGMPFPASRLTACDKFVMDSWDVSRAATVKKSGRFEILHVLSGQGRLSDGRWPHVQLKKGRTVLVPACASEYELRPAGKLRIIRMAEGVCD